MHAYSSVAVQLLYVSCLTKPSWYSMSVRLGNKTPAFASHQVSNSVNYELRLSMLRIVYQQENHIIVRRISPFKKNKIKYSRISSRGPLSIPPLDSTD